MSCSDRKGGGQKQFENSWFEGTNPEEMRLVGPQILERSVAQGAGTSDHVMNDLHMLVDIVGREERFVTRRAVEGSHSCKGDGGLFQVPFLVNQNNSNSVHKHLFAGRIRSAPKCLWTNGS